MNHLFLVIKREYLTKVRNKSFIVMTFLSPLIFIGLAALVGYLSSINSNKLRTVAIIDDLVFSLRNLMTLNLLNMSFLME